jgi:hypothetical protein
MKKNKLAWLFLFILNSAIIYSVNYKAYRTVTPPIIDGIANEDCWKTANWSQINQPFDGKILPDSADYYGRYKAVWDASKLYILMEITDEKMVDNRANPKDNYWADDCAEFFIDEDHISQGHECGVNAFKAFAYHVAAVARDKNNYTSGSIVSHDAVNAVQHVIDLGTDCNTANALNLDDHVNVKISKNVNRYTWELGFKIFDKNFNQTISTNTPVILTPNKVMGFAIAYCDDDTGVRDNMIGTVPNHNDYSGTYPFYRFTNDYGTITLNDSVLISTTAIRPVNTLKGCLIVPNPVGNTLNINTDNIDTQFNRIQIVNLSGVTILTHKLESSNYDIDVSFIPSGIYVLRVLSKESQLQQYFIKK